MHLHRSRRQGTHRSQGRGKTSPSVIEPEAPGNAPHVSALEKSGAVTATQVQTTHDPKPRIARNASEMVNKVTPTR